MEKPREELRFYSKNKETAYFSNFYPAPIEIDDKRYPTVEHYYQAQKFEDMAFQNRVRKAKYPGQAKLMTRGNNVPPVRADWEEIKESVIETALAAKFSQNPELKVRLIATAPKRLIEDSPRDYYWGCGSDGSGKNRMGILLENLRDRLIAEEDCIKH